MKRRIMGLLPQVAWMVVYTGAGWIAGWVVEVSPVPAVAAGSFLGTLALAAIVAVILRDQGRGR